MKNTYLAMLLSLLSVTVGEVEADSFKIDFGPHNGASPVADGWNVFGWTTGSATGPSNITYACSNAGIARGAVTVGLTSGSSPEDSTAPIVARDRGEVADASVYPLAAVYRDWVNANSELWVTLRGLHPQTIYRFKAYAYDHNNTKTVTLCQWADGKDVTESVSISYTAGTSFTAETSADIYAAELELVTDKEGTAIVRISSTPLIAGFELMRGREWEPFEILVDFGDNDVAKLQAGAKQFYGSENPDPRSWTYDGLSPKGSSREVTVKISLAEIIDGKKIITRDRENGGAGAIVSYKDIFPYYNLFRDLTIAQVPSMWIDVEGLTAGAQYRVVICPYDYNNTKSYTLADWTFGETSNVQSLATTKNLAFSADTPRDTYVFARKAKADENGRLKLKLMSNVEVGIAWLEIKYLEPKGLVLSVW